jgi:hypothetical protein
MPIKVYQLKMEHSFIVKTNDIEEVLKNYEFPDFTNCTSIVGEPEFNNGKNDYWILEEENEVA